MPVEGADELQFTYFHAGVLSAWWFFVETVQEHAVLVMISPRSRENDLVPE